MKLVIISDTHKQHRKIEMPKEGDILIHCGDITSHGEMPTLIDFNNWLGELPYKHKLICAGNHEVGFKDYSTEYKKNLFSNGTYLEDEEMIIDGIKFYFSPHQPWFFDWEFNFSKDPEQYKTEATRVWNKIPDDTNVLVTHSPSYSRLDKIINPRKNEDPHVGCKYLLNRVKELKSLKIHCAGHLHESYGVQQFDHYTAINAAILNDQYQIANKPIIMEI